MPPPVTRVLVNAAKFFLKGERASVSSGPLTLCTVPVLRCKNDKGAILGNLVFHQGPDKSVDEMKRLVEEQIPKDAAVKELIHVQSAPDNTKTLQEALEVTRRIDAKDLTTGWWVAPRVDPLTSEVMMDIDAEGEVEIQKGWSQSLYETFRGASGGEKT